MPRLSHQASCHSVASKPISQLCSPIPIPFRHTQPPSLNKRKLGRVIHFLMKLCWLLKSTQQKSMPFTSLPQPCMANPLPLQCHGCVLCSCTLASSYLALSCTRCPYPYISLTWFYHDNWATYSNQITMNPSLSLSTVETFLAVFYHAMPHTHIRLLPSHLPPTRMLIIKAGLLSFVFPAFPSLEKAPESNALIRVVRVSWTDDICFSIP